MAVEVAAVVVVMGVGGSSGIGEGEGSGGDSDGGGPYNNQLKDPADETTAAATVTATDTATATVKATEKDENNADDDDGESRIATKTASPGCVGTLDDGYVRNVHLPRAPRIQSARHVTGYGAVTRDASDTCYSQVTRVPTWSDLLMRLLAGLGRCTKRSIYPFSPVRLL